MANRAINLSLELDDNTRNGIQSAQRNLGELRDQTISIDTDVDVSEAQNQIHDLTNIERSASVAVSIDDNTRNGISAVRRRIQSLRDEVISL